MNVQEVYDQFRADMVDTAKPYLWSDADVFRHMDDAYKMFVRLMGGIADFTSDMTRVDIAAGDPLGVMDKRILRVMEAYRASDAAEIKIINQTDLTFARGTDYGTIRPVYLDTTPGPVRYMIIGAERGKCKWVQVPVVADVAQLYVYRLPSTKIDGTNLSFEFDEIGEEHHSSLVLWMRHKGYMKADAETFDRGRSGEFKAAFTEYCSLAKAEWERYKHKNREVAYGGI